MSLSSTPKLAAATAPPVLLDNNPRGSVQESRTSPACPHAGDTELDTGTLTESASMWSRQLIGQSVVLKKVMLVSRIHRDLKIYTMNIIYL